MNWSVPLTDVRITDDDVEAVLRCLRSGWLTMGPNVQAFERGFAEYVGAAHAVAVSSGTAALHLAAIAAGVTPGDEVIVPNLTFVASAAAARYCGATVVLCDSLGPTDLNLDPDDVRSLITERTRAVIAVHFMGYAAEVEALRALCNEHQLHLIEDTAQGLGARTRSGAMAGTVGELGCYSFFSKKQLSVGEGGMVVTDNPDLAARIRLLRSHGMTSVTWDRHLGYAESYDVVDIGFNFRMDEPHAALGLSRMPRLDEDTASRRARVRQYRAALAAHPAITIPWSDRDVACSSHFAFPILLPDRRTCDRLRLGLAAVGIQTTAYPAISELSAYQTGNRVGAARSTDLAQRHCVLPLSPVMTEADVETVVTAVFEVLEVDGAAQSGRAAAIN
ncbi:MAG: DegT/DnrJ/EryC1/StrS family aminotransferase [Solirubrobacterales bacterium]|nr:DegT/DnrJ/EryC1/StrS family aminotransferase [Solirubrobacterales bacterium]